jgi:hypothetical protein
MPVCMPVPVSLCATATLPIFVYVAPHAHAGVHACACVVAHARLDTGCAYVPMPMCHSVVTDTHMHGTGGQIRRNKRLADDVSLPELAAKTKNYSGAEIQGARTRTHTHTHMKA